MWNLIVIWIHRYYPYLHDLVSLLKREQSCYHFRPLIALPHSGSESLPAVSATYLLYEVPVWDYLESFVIELVARTTQTDDGMTDGRTDMQCMMVLVRGRAAQCPTTWIWYRVHRFLWLLCMKYANHTCTRLKNNSIIRYARTFQSSDGYALSRMLFAQASQHLL